MALLDWIGSEDTSHPLDLESLEDSQIPNKPGAYILMCKGNIRLLYPNGKSPIYYIGQTGNLRERLIQHRKLGIKARKRAINEPIYFPRYEYFASFGARCVWLRTRGGQRPKGLEDVLMAKFARKYYSFPVANGMGAWKKVWEVLSGGQ